MRFKKLFELLYLKLVKANDTPQRLSLGLGIGVFSGILPGTGPVFALFLAWVLRLNRASALAGSLLTNTWLSIVVLLLSIKAGSAVFGLKWQDVYSGWSAFIRGFHWKLLLRSSLYQLILPVLTGYAIIALGLALAAYIIALICLTFINHPKNRPGPTQP